MQCSFINSFVSGQRFQPCHDPCSRQGRRKGATTRKPCRQLVAVLRGSVRGGENAIPVSRGRSMSVNACYQQLTAFDHNGVILYASTRKVHCV